MVFRYQLPRHSFNPLHKVPSVGGSLCDLRQIVFPFGGKHGRGQHIRQNGDKRVAVCGGDKLLALSFHKAGLHQLFNDSGAGGGSAKPPAFRVRVGVLVPGAFHCRQKGCFVVGLRRRCEMLRHLCRGIFKGLSLGKLRQGIFCFGFLVRLAFQCRTVAAFKVFPAARKYCLSPCCKFCICAGKNRRDSFVNVRLGGSENKTRPGKGEDIPFTFRQRSYVGLCKLHSRDNGVVV